MKKIKLNNKSILDILNSMSIVVYEPTTLDKIFLMVDDRKCSVINEYPGYSDEYLYKAKEQDILLFGYPRAVLATPMNYSETLHDVISKQVGRLQRKLGARDNALSMMYPKNGFIGWHHNGNAPGYNVLFSYSLDGKGRFKFFDYETESIQVIEDEPGWNVKVGYYPSEQKEPNRLYWHEAETENPRLSIAFIINNRELWRNMISDITNGDYDADFIENQGPKETYC